MGCWRIAHPPRPAPSPYLRALRLVCRDGGGELLIVLAIAARFCDLAELLGGTRHVALGQERLAHVLARSRVGRIDGQRAAVVLHAAVDVAELAGGKAGDAQNARVVLVVGSGGDLEGGSIVAVLRLPVGGLIDFVVARSLVLPQALGLAGIFRGRTVDLRLRRVHGRIGGDRTGDQGGGGERQEADRVNQFRVGHVSYLRWFVVAPARYPK